MPVGLADFLSKTPPSVHLPPPCQCRLLAQTKESEKSEVNVWLELLASSL